MTAITLESLAQRVAALEQRLASEAHPGPSTSSLSAWMPEVRRITEEMFPGPFSYDEESDPEYPDDTYVIINVETSSDTSQVIRRECEWHDRVRALAPELFGRLRLWISPR